MIINTNKTRSFNIKLSSTYDQTERINDKSLQGSANQDLMLIQGGPVQHDKE